MSEWTELFRRRIGLSEHTPVTFEHLSGILEKTAMAVPFENMRIMSHSTMAITKENLVQKIAANGEGGLCYELNTLLYFFLLEHGLDAALTRGSVYNHTTGQFSSLGKTHVTILLKHAGQLYVVDTGFGGNLPLTPVPLTGESITSANGEFRIKQVDSEHGDAIFEMKLKHKDTEWQTGYAFDSMRPIADLAELNEIQKRIAESPESLFNKNPLLTRLTGEGSVTLTDTSLTQREHNVVTKRSIQPAEFEELRKRYFPFSDPEQG